MTYQGRDPEREAHRAGGGDDSDFVLGADGRPLRDRYGRPVKRRGASSSRSPRQSPSRAQHADPAAQRARQQRREETRFDVDAYMAQRAPRRAVQPQGYQQQGNQQSRQVPGYQQGHYSPPQAQPAPRSYYAPGDPRRRPHSRRKRVNPLKRGLGCLGWAVAAFLVFTLAFGLWTDSRLSRVQALPEQRVANTAGTNWLLVGSDSRQGLTEAEQMELGTGGDVGVGRTDTIMLLHIPTTGKAKLVSIPRDSYVDVPGFGTDKINAAFTYGGPQLLTQTVEQATGLRIDHYAEIGMGGLANVVDSVGGVKICVAEPITDPLAGIDLAAGCQNLRGPDALGYVRTRATAMGDLDRVQRQREFFAALLHKVTSPATLLNPFRSISLVNHTAKSFIVGEKDHVWHLARVALAMGSGVETETVPVGGFADTSVGNVVLWDEVAAPALWDSLR